MAKRTRLEISGELAEEVLEYYEGLGYRSFREFMTVLMCQRRMRTANLPSIGIESSTEATPEPTQTYVNPRGGYDDFEDEDD